MAESVLNREEQKIDANKDPQESTARTSRIKRIAGIVLSLIMIGLSVYVFVLQNDNNKILNQSTNLALNSGVSQASNYRTYVKQYKDTKVQLEETTRKLEEVTKQLNDVTAELNTTKSMLTETQIMLTQAQSENNKLKEDLQGLDGITAGDGSQNISDLEARIAALKLKNSQTTGELNDLKSQLRAFQADFSTLQEGRSLISLFQNKIKLVKNRMRHLEQEAYFAKVAAQKERDRLAALNGNNGYLIQNGVSRKSGGNKSFSIDVKMVQ